MNKVLVVLVVIVAFAAGVFAGYKYEKDKLVSMSASKDAMYMKQIGDLKKAQEEIAMNSQQAANSVFAVKTDPKLGKYLTDAKGMTLYVYDKDTKGVSSCTGTCAVNWPPYIAKDTTAKLPQDVTLVKRADGSMEYAYNNMPLYYYKADAKPGDTNGDGVGGVWHVAKEK